MKAPVLPAAAAPAPNGGTAFGVHVSSFRRRSTAESEARRLAAQLSLPARVLEADLGAKGVWYRVVVGEVSSSSEAAVLLEQLEGKGVTDSVVLGYRRGK